tara:strand:+ start:252 stop:413 length:162 start_codon:yes stop_codon:yes gene_type:complete
MVVKELVQVVVVLVKQVTMVIPQIQMREMVDMVCRFLSKVLDHNQKEPLVQVL